MSRSKGASYPLGYLIAFYPASRLTPPSFVLRRRFLCSQVRIEAASKSSEAAATAGAAATALASQAATCHEVRPYPISPTYEPTFFILILVTAEGYKEQMTPTHDYMKDVFIYMICP